MTASYRNCLMCVCAVLFSALLYPVLTKSDNSVVAVPMVGVHV